VRPVSTPFSAITASSARPGSKAKPVRVKGMTPFTAMATKIS